MFVIDRYKGIKNMKRNYRIILVGFVGLIFSICLQSQNLLPLYLDCSKPIEQRISDAIKRMTLAEKIRIIHAQSKFSSRGVPRLGIPDLWTSDGPHGVRPEVLWDKWSSAGWSNDSCIAFPALTCLAATWNPSLAFLYGQSIGEEAKYRHKNVLLGPGVNIYRTPLGGRNFEYMGEDPYLASKMVVPYIQGVQINGVSACVKHFVLNDQEYNRHTTNVIVDDRALYEIYLPAFKAAVTEGKVWAVMGSYNLYKNEHSCHNQYLLNNILRKEWGFDGVVISDWGGTYNTMQAIKNGLDLEFGTYTNGMTSGASNTYEQYYMAMPYLKLIQQGQIGTVELDQKVRNVLRLMFRTSMNGKTNFGSMNSEAHSIAGKEIGEDGIVLLKNERNLLPLDLTGNKKIEIVGENAIKMMSIGGGSASLKVSYEITPLEGLKTRIGDKATIVYARGYVGDTISSYDNVHTLQKLQDNRSSDELIKEAVTIAKSADYVIYIGGLNKSNYQDCEGVDRLSLDLPYSQDRLISELAKANKNTIVVNISGNAVAMPWVNKVSSIVQAWYLGSEAGNALASVLCGDINPSGKLPFTFPAKLSDVGAIAAGEYPGNKEEIAKQGDDKNIIVNEKYNEGIYVGYRWTDKYNIKPLFSFGHGLSYTTFQYGRISVDKTKMAVNDSITFKIPVKNIGKRAGAEVVELYIKDVKSSLSRPIKELKGFKKVMLRQGEQKEVSITIDKSALSFFDPIQHKWIAEPGDFIALIGSSSTDIRCSSKFTLK